MAEDRIISLDVGSQHVTGAVFSPVGAGGLRLDRLEHRAFVGDPADDESRQSQSGLALKEIGAELKLKGAKTRYVIPSQPVLMKFASIPALDGERIDQIVEFEAQQQVPYPINEVVWGYQLMGDPDDVEAEVVLAAIKSDELTDIDQLIADAGLKSTGAEVAPIALYNALRYNYSDVEGTVLLVDIGARTTDLIFMEGESFFVRTVKIGGADLTRAVAKEFGSDFGAIDRRKTSDGFVALGGAYADAEDPEVAAMSKILRQSLTRLHSEVMRTINFYRSQQGGSAPSIVLMSGGTSALPFIREFFAEKLNSPVDHFNALRNVMLGSGIDAEVAASNAHHLGEVVGSALAQTGEVPVRLDLIPESVRKDRALDKRKPALILSVIVLAALLGVVGFFFSRGATLTEAKSAEIEGTADELRAHNGDLEDLRAQIDGIDNEQQPYVEAVRHRVYWVRVFNYLSEKLEDDLMFFTVLEPIANGRPVIPSSDGLIAVAATDAEQVIDAFSIQGLWRENPNGSQIVFDYYSRLKSDAEENPQAAYFALEDVDISEVVKPEAGTGGTHYAYPFLMTLPLPEANQVKFSK